jgi:hypothetical protein
LDKKEKRGQNEGRGRKRKKGNWKEYQGPEGAALFFLLSHGEARLDSFHYYAGPSVKTYEAWVYVGGGA